MKKAFLLLSFALSLVLTYSCGTNRLIGTKETLTVVHDSVNFELVKIRRLGTMNSYGGGTFTSVRKGKFYIITLASTNNSNTTKTVDLDKVYLCDANRNCLEVGRIDYNTIVDMPAKHMMKIAPYRKEERHMFYAGPKDFIPAFLVINHEDKCGIKFGYNKE